jgi:hypothetical protein
MNVPYVCPTQAFFLGDVVLDSINALILFILAWYTFRVCGHIRANCNQTNPWLRVLGAGATIIGVSFVLKSILNYCVLRSVTAIPIFSTITLFESVGAWVSIGIIAHQAITILGFFILYRIYARKDPIVGQALVLLLAFAAIILTQFNYIVFYLVIALLVAITTIRHAHIGKNKYITVSFALLALSYIGLGSVLLMQNMYFVGKIFRAISFILLLISVIITLKNGKKKK